MLPPRSLLPAKYGQAYSKFTSLFLHKTMRRLTLAAAVVLACGVMMYYSGQRSRLAALESPQEQAIPYPLSDLSLFQTDLYNRDGTDEENLVITDVVVVTCYQRSCKAPPGYNKVQPPFNHHKLNSLVNMKYTYYLAIRKENIDQATRILTGITTDFSDEATNFEYMHVDGFDFFKTFVVVNPGTPVPEDLPLVRNLDVLFGSNDLTDSRHWWESIHLSQSNEIEPVISLMSLSVQDQKVYSEYWRNWRVVKKEMLIPHTSSRKYKVLQVSDLHFGTSLGRCSSEEGCTSDFKSIKFIDNSILEERPDLVVITGDLIDVHRAVDFKSVLLKALQPILQHHINFVFTFGDEIGSKTNEHLSKLTRFKILDFLDSLPNCLNTPMIDNSIHGMTNYNLNIIDAEGQTAAITVLDSASRLLDDSQMNYLYRLHKQGDSLFKLLFFHYPIPQFRPSGVFKIVGKYNEKHTLESEIDAKFHDDIVNCGYQVVAVGHEHENDACILSEKDNKKIWLCYGSVAGDSGETKMDTSYSRKVRLFEIDFEKKELLSWKRNEVDKKGFDYQMIHKY